MKAMVVLVISLLALAFVTLFWPSKTNDSGDMSYNEDISVLETDHVSEVEQVKPLSPEVTAPSSDEKIELMTAEYQILEKTRKKLKQRLSRLRHEMWGMKFPSEQAKQMSEILLNAHKLIKNPDMLGAFSSVAAIQDEISKVEFADKALDHVSQMIEQNKNSATAEQ